MNEFLDDPAILEEFINESNEYLESLEPKLLKLEKEPNNLELLNDIFRSFHSIKGASSFLNLTQIIKLSHKLESVLDNLRRERLKVTSEIIDLLFKGVDILKALFGDLASGEKEKVEKITGNSFKEVDEFINNIEEKIKKPQKEESKGKTFLIRNKPTGEEKEVFLTATEQHLRNMENCLTKIKRENLNPELINALFRIVHSLKSSAAYMGFEKIKNLANEEEIFLDKIREGVISPSQQLFSLLRLCYESFVKLIDNVRSERKEDFNINPLLNKIKETYQTEKPQEILTSKSSSAREKKKLIKRTIRVEETKLDLLLNLVSELVINRSSFFTISEKLENKCRVPEISRELKNTTQTLRRITTDLQVLVTDLHMRPIKNLFNKFSRLVRDLSQERGKKINLKISGEETKLDKMVIEEITDPLIHLIRNAVDHGIETPQERRRQGKNPVGTIILSASQEGNNVTIKIKDDGRGIDPEIIRKVAIEKGIIDKDKGDSLRKKEILDLIFLPGFTTAKKVSDISGRGVGMDVVKNNIKKLKGEIEIDTQINTGTTFTIRLPLTLAIINALLVEVSGQVFALPVNCLAETVKVSLKEIKKVLKKQFLTLRGEILGLVKLSKLFSIPEESQNSKRIYIAVIQANRERIGLIVDTLLRQEEIVIKPLEGCLSDIQGLAGVTILGDGRVIPIIDPQGLIWLAKNSGLRDFRSGKNLSITG